MIPNEKNLQSRLHFPDLKTDLHFYHEGGGIYYELLYYNCPLFTGTGYRPNSDHFSISSMIALLDTLVYPPEEVEKEYEPGRRSWLQTIRGTALAGYIKKYNVGKPKKRTAAESYIKRAYTKYIHSDFFSLNDVVSRAPKGRMYITIRQRSRLRELLLKNILGQASKSKIDAAISDSFKKLKKHPLLEAIIFNEEQVTFMRIRSNNYNLGAVLQRIIEKY